MDADRNSARTANEFGKIPWAPTSSAKNTCLFSDEKKCLLIGGVPDYMMLLVTEAPIGSSADLRNIISALKLSIVRVLKV